MPHLLPWDVGIVQEQWQFWLNWNTFFFTYTTDYNSTAREEYIKQLSEDHENK